MFTITFSRNNGRTVTKREGLNWPQAVNEATSFVSTTVNNGTDGSRLMVAVQDAAGTGEPVQLPGGCTIEIDLVEE